jgi:hypothetical protein
LPRTQGRRRSKLRALDMLLKHFGGHAPSKHEIGPTDGEAYVERQREADRILSETEACERGERTPWTEN